MMEPHALISTLVDKDTGTAPLNLTLIGIKSGDRQSADLFTGGCGETEG